MSFTATGVGDVPGSPCQPSHTLFPKRSFGKTCVVKRSFQAGWFQRWKWLHYSIVQDSVVRCFSCCTAVRNGCVRITGQAEKSFLVSGFSKWKDASAKFAKHDSSDFHKHCMEALSSADVRKFSIEGDSMDGIYHRFQPLFATLFIVLMNHTIIS